MASSGADVVYPKTQGWAMVPCFLFHVYDHGNVGLKSSSYNSGKGTAAVAAHVRDLEQKLERSELQDEVMQEEMAAIKMKAEEYEAARDKELELMCKKSQEHEQKLAHLMALFGAKAS
ncbi:hypothetical protein D1007_00837 [Hordeum vulgare]|nr:hypothetical protein D1007_00837 [Hordeum vulgare]